MIVARVELDRTNESLHWNVPAVVVVVAWGLKCALVGSLVEEVIGGWVIVRLVPVLREIDIMDLFYLRDRVRVFYYLLRVLHNFWLNIF